MTPLPENILKFWLDEVGPGRWFQSSAALDAEIAGRFGAVWRAAKEGALKEWEGSAQGALALVIVLDQFPRNMFRGKPDAFSTDAAARAVADRALARGDDFCVPQALRVFFYLPFMHSEDIADQDRCVDLIAERLGKDVLNYRFARDHRDQIARFGRFPGRNAALGRLSTAEEVRFLAQYQPPRPS